jgi:hypothetical protein
MKAAPSKVPCTAHRSHQASYYNRVTALLQLTLLAQSISDERQILGFQCAFRSQTGMSCTLHICVTSVQVAVPKPGALKPAAVKLNKQRLRERLSQAVGIASSLVSPRRWSKQGAAGKAVGYGAMGSSKGGLDVSQGGLCPLAVPKVSTVSNANATL